MTRYASQVHTNPQPATIALFLNTRLAPLNRLDVRRALKGGGALSERDGAAAEARLPVIRVGVAGPSARVRAVR